jgi:hypothetical protein
MHGKCLQACKFTARIGIFIYALFLVRENRYDILKKFLFMRMANIPRNKMEECLYRTVFRAFNNSEFGIARPLYLT